MNPVVYRQDGDDLVVFASKAGAPTNPDWYHNLVADHRRSVEVGTDTFDVVARVAEGEEWDSLFDRQKQDMPGFADYEAKTTRQIPVVILHRAG